MDCRRCREKPDAICPCKAPMDATYPGEIDYDPEEHGWKLDDGSMTKRVRGRLVTIWWNHHGAGYSIEGLGYDLLKVEGRHYYTTTNATAWEIDNGLGVGDFPPLAEV